MICLYFKIPEKFGRLIYLDGLWVVHIPFVRMVKLKIFAQFPGNHLPCPECLVLDSLCTNLLHSLIMGFIVLSLSSHNLHLLFFASCLFLLFCAAIGRDSVSFIMFLFFSYVEGFSCEISLACLSKCPYNCFSSHFCFLDIFDLLMLEWSMSSLECKAQCFLALISFCWRTSLVHFKNGSEYLTRGTP